MFGQVSFVFLYKKLSMELGVESEYIYVYKLMNKMSIKYYIYYKYVVVTEKKTKEVVNSNTRAPLFNRNFCNKENILFLVHPIW